MSGPSALSRSGRLFAEHRFEAEPNGPDDAANNCGNDDLECQALRLFDALAPFAEMGEVSPQLFAILFLNAE